MAGVDVQFAVTVIVVIAALAYGLRTVARAWRGAGAACHGCGPRSESGCARETPAKDVFIPVQGLRLRARGPAPPDVS
jgi:hypothetical protein